MEAVPKLPMIYFELKISPICPDFTTPFKRFISIHYSEDGNSYDREIHELETLRNKASRVPRDFTGCSLLKRYYSQIYSLQNRFAVFESSVGVECVWADIYSGQTVIGDLDYELGCVLYNIGALHAELGALDLRNSAENMKVSCTHFQCAVWAFQHLRDDNRLYKSKDMSHDLLSFFVQVMLSQAQECILEKSMLDNRKSSIVAKVAAQVVEYYSSSLLLLLQAALNTSSSHTIVDIVGSKIYKEWKKFIEFKVSYYNSICALFMGNLAQEQQKMGERVAWFQSAEQKLNEAIKQAKQLDKPELNEALTFVSDVINVKLGNAVKENDFVYHQKVPTNDKLTEVKGVSLVKGIPFSVCDPEISGPDIFGRLVPIEAHETASIYSAKKDEIMRNIGIKIDDKDQELAAYMSSIQIDRDTLRAKEDQIPDQLIEVCAVMSVNPDSVNEVNHLLTELEEMSEEVDKTIKETKSLLEDEEKKEREHQQMYGKRPTSMIVVELSKELVKLEDTHKKALLSNSSLRDNLDRHCDDVKLLISSSAQDVASLLPSTGSNVPFDESNLAEMERLLEKVEEMKNQRSMLENQLKDTMTADDVMKQVLAHNKQEIEGVFDNEIKKYDRIIALIEQNLSAQDNILRALTKANAKYAETRRAILDNERNRSARIASLIHTYDVFKELQTNSKKGFDFYQKFQNIVSRLQARTRGVCRVQDEERAQIFMAHKKNTTKYLPNQTQVRQPIRQPQVSQPQVPQRQVSHAQIPQPQVPQLHVSQAQVFHPQAPQAQVSQAPVFQPQVPQTHIPQTQVSQAPVFHTQVSQSQVPQAQVPQPQVSQPQVSQTQFEQQYQPYGQQFPQQFPQPLPQQCQQTYQQTYEPPNQYNFQQQYQLPVQQPIPQSLPQTMSQTNPHSMPQSMPQNIPQTMSQNIPQTMSQNIPQTMSQNIPQTMSQNIPQTMSQNIPQTMLQNMQPMAQPYQPVSQPIQPVPQQYPQQFPQQFSQQYQQTYQQTYESPNQYNFQQQYQLPVQQPIPQSLPQTMSQTNPHSMPQSVPQTMSQNIPQTMLQTIQPMAQPIQPLPLPIQPVPQQITQEIPQQIPQQVSQPSQPVVEAKSEKPSENNGSDLLKQFDPLYDLKNGF